MNLDDLRSELDAHARDIDPYATGRMSGIRAKIAQRRRRKAGATVAASVLAVGAIIGVPVASHLSAGPEPAEGGGRFPEKIDGDTRIAEAVGDEGDTKVTMTFTPEDTDFLLDIDCDDFAQGYVRARVNGRRTDALCGTNAPGVTTGEVGGVASPAKVRRLWERTGVRAGEPVTVTLRVMDETLTPVRSIEGTVGVAAYAMTGERRNVVGVALPEEKTVDGETYALADDGYTVAPTRPNGSQDLYVPESDGPTLVTYGAGSGRMLTRGSIDGAQGALPTTGGVSSELLPSGGARTIAVDNLSDAESAKLVVAYYTPAEDDEDTDPPDLSFPTVNDNRDPLLASGTGEQGETVFQTTFAPYDANVELAVACDLGDLDALRSIIRLTVEVNGAKVGRVRCRPENTFKLNELANARGIRPGQPIEVEVRMETDNISDDTEASVTLGAALYECSAPRVDVNGFLLPREHRHDGVWYELADSDGVDVGRGQRRASLHRSPSGEPIVIASAFVESGDGWGADLGRR